MILLLQLCVLCHHLSVTKTYIQAVSIWRRASDMQAYVERLLCNRQAIDTMQVHCLYY